MRHAGPLPTHPDEDDLVALADAVRERAGNQAGLPNGRLTCASMNGFSDSPLRSRDAGAHATAASGGLLAPPEPHSGRRRGHLRVLPDPAD